MAETLLEKAKKVPRDKKSKNITEEEIDLALAWLKREINPTQLAAILDITYPANTANWLTSRIKIAYDKGLLVIKE